MRRTGHALLLLAMGSASPAAGDAPLPYTLAVEVLQGPHRVPAAVAQAVGEGITAGLRERGCVRAVATGEGANADVLLRLILDDALEETRYDLGIADRARVQNPEAERSYVSTFEVRARVELVTIPERDPVRAKSFRTKTERRPVAPGEDAAALARSDAITRIVREARSFLCGGSRKRLAREIEAALSHGSGASTPPTRPRVR